MATTGTKSEITLESLLAPDEDATDPAFDWSDVVERSAELGAAPAAGLPPLRVALAQRVYYFSRTWRVERTLHLVGAGRNATALWFAHGKHGLYFAWSMTDGRRSDHSLVERLALVAYGEDNTGDGIVVRAPMAVRDVAVQGFRDGINIFGAAVPGQADGASAANVWKLQDVRIDSCWRHGLCVDGPDGNAGYALGVDCSDNRGWGFYDSSFLGNTYVACHASTNRLGSYKSDDPNARNLFLNCYSESDQGPAEVAPPSMVIGGLLGVVGGGGHLTMNGGELAVNRVRSHVAGLTARLGGTAPQSVLEFEDPIGRVFRVLRSPPQLDAGPGWWGLNYQMVYTVLGFCDQGAAEYAMGGAPHPKLAFPLGVMLGHGPGRIMLTAGQGPPAGGTWPLGARVLNSAPARGAPSEWLCVAAGSPGTWVAGPLVP